MPLLEQVLENNPETVKVVFKNMPLRFHKLAEPSARAALAANEQANTIEARYLDLPMPDPSVRAISESPRSTASDTPKQAVKERWEQLTEHREALENTEREIIEDALFKYRGVVAKAARELSVSRTGLISRMATLGIGPDKAATEQVS